MKKKFISFMLVLGLLTSFASATYSQTVRASDYLLGYGVSIEAVGDGLMEVFYEVDGKGMMSRIGALAIYIDQKVNGTWISYDTLLSAKNPDFLVNDDLGHAGVTYFEGTPGVEYRVTLEAFAMGYDGGSDTGTVTSQVAVCR